MNISEKPKGCLVKTSMIKCDICRFQNPDGFAYCGRCGNGLSDASSSLEPPDWSNIEGERRQVTIIFADISGFTALNDAAQSQADIEQVIQITNHCFHMLSEVVYEYDGYVDKYMGDSVMAIFGAPRMHEDDPERALRAALAMRERLEAFNQNPPFPLAEPLGIHLGINTGIAIAGLFGSHWKRSYTVMGDAVNVASRLEHVSERGEFFVSQDTYNLTHRLFVFKERDPVSVKGKPEPLKIYELIGARSQRASQRGIAGLRAPMVGREREIETLREKVSRLDQGQGSINIILGDAGLGKSRLTSELQQETVQKYPHIHWFEGRGLSFQQHLSYKLFIEILRQYLGVSADESGERVWQTWQTVGQALFGRRENEVTPYLATLMGIKLPETITQNMPLTDPMLLRQRMFTAIGEWVEAVVEQQPMVLVFEDLHWADTNSVNLLEYLMSICIRLPLTLLCVTRPERAVDFWQVRKQASVDYIAHYAELHLVPLTNDQSRFLVDRLLSVEQLPDSLEQLILSRSEGNPLFMEEVLRSLIEDETLVKEGDSWVMAKPVTEINIPETLAGVLTARIDRLDEAVKRTLQIASVIGRVFHRDILEAVIDDPQQLDDHLVALIAAELVRERPNDLEKEFIFKHVLVQEAAYNGLLLSQRQIYHRQIADYAAQLYWMRGEEYANLAAQHYELGKVWKRALTYLTRSAEASQNSFDNINAINFYTRALNVSEKVSQVEPKTLIKIYEGRGNLLKRLGQIEEAKTDFEKILQLAETDHDAVIQMRALNELGKLHDDYQDYSQTARYFKRALGIAREVEDQPGIVEILNELADFHINMGQLNQAEAYLNEAMTVATVLDNKRSITDCQDGLAALMLYRGSVQESIAQLENLVQIWRNLGHYQGLMRTYMPLIAGYMLQGDYATSHEICQDAIEILDRFGDLTWLPQIRFYLAQCAFVQGDLLAAETNIDLMIETAAKLGKGTWHAVGLAHQGYYGVVQGEIEPNLAKIERAVQMAEAIDAPLWTGRIKLIKGLAYRQIDRLLEAEAVLAEVFQMVQAMQFVTDEVISLTELLEVRLAIVRWGKISPELDHLLKLAEGAAMKPYQAKVLHLSARIVQRRQNAAEALGLIAQARSLTQKTGDSFTALAILSTQGQILIGQGQINEANIVLQEAGQILQTMTDTVQDADKKQHLLDRYEQSLSADITLYR